MTEWYQLDHELVDGLLDGQDLTLQLPLLVRRNARSDDRPRDATRPTQRSLGLDEDVRHVLYIHNHTSKRPR